ncbi:hypothetical protein K435DRAFT_477782 [Dendrothele bispora CBS 962.96]|uniref:Uncharacterized protein n=1 Tax=Dendrothele bispora (strain CBS 962.96) TaxID=1314807 RepID=A0A4S8KZ85_DENBC|nr:hypothetical protein K435DRAFT_477782 [Dendrothele bispora CBS 962.96]
MWYVWVDGVFFQFFGAKKSTGIISPRPETNGTTNLGLFEIPQRSLPSLAIKFLAIKDLLSLSWPAVRLPLRANIVAIGYCYPQTLRPHPQVLNILRCRRVIISAHLKFKTALVHL